VALKAKLGGTWLNYGFQWELAAGVAPVQRGFVMSKHRAEAIFKRGRQQLGGKSVNETRTRQEQPTTGPLELSIGKHTFRGLYALEVHPVDDNLSSVLVADGRWLLKRKHLLREYNLRRRTGMTRFVQREETPIQVNQPVADYAYKRITLNEGKEWTARECLEDVLKELVGDRYRIAPGLTLTVDVESIQIDDDGDAALSRVLALMPGAGVYYDRQGLLVIYNTLDQSEGSVVDKVKKAGRKWWGDTISLIDRALVRPSQVGVFFEQEIELRLDYTEGATATTRTRQQDGREPREIENIIPVVHPRVTFQGKEYPRGSWLQADDWITATQAQLVTDGDSSTDFPLSQELFRIHAPTGFAIPRAVIAKYLVNTQSPVLDMMWNAIQTHWRKTFRITSRYMDKLKSIRAVRVAVKDQETGTRGRAEVFADYMIRPSRRGLVKRANENSKAAYNFSSYAESLQNKSPSPVVVTVIDPDVGIFTLNFTLDPFGEAVQVIPGNLSTDGENKIPSWDMSSLEGLEEAYTHWNSKTVRLSTEYKVAIILTAVMASPTNVSRYHLETVSAAEAQGVLPSASIGECLGPDWAFKVGAGIDTARWAWKDALASDIDQAVWDGKDMPENQLLNPQVLKHIARARAGMVYELLLDRHEGTMSLSMDGSIEPTGSLRSVVHRLSPAGVASTTLVMPPITIPPDMWALMPDSTRKFLQRRVQN